MTRGLAVTTITRNEAANLARCLESVAWAQEIVVLDAESTDRTTDIARRFTSKVFVRRWPGFAAQKNFALTHVTQPWVLSLDADEEVSPELRAEIEEVLAADGPLDGYFVPRKNFFLGRWIRHGRWFPDYQLRLFRRGRGAFRPVSVHEGLAVEGRVGYLKAPLLHQSYRGIDDFVERANRYSSLAAQDLVQHERRISAVHLLARPLARFCSMYLVHRGFLDGRHGLLLASLYSYYVFLRYAKAWELGRRDTRSVVDEVDVTPERDMLAK